MVMTSKILVFLITFLIYSNVFLYLFTISVSPISPFLFHISLILLAIGLVLCLKKSICFNHTVIYYSFFLMAYFSLIFLMVGQNSDGAMLLVTEIYLLLFFIVSFLFFSSSIDFLTYGRRAILCVGVLSCIIFIYDFTHPFKMLPFELSNPGRASGFYINPNSGGTALVLSFIIGYDIIWKKIKDLVFILFLIGIVLTFSRGAILAMALTIFFMLYYRQISVAKISLITVIGILVVPSIGILLLNMALDQGHINIDNIMQRLNWFETMGQSGDFSTNERLVAAIRALDAVEQHPIFGMGISHVSSWEVLPHNMYLYYAAMYGMTGFFLYPIFVLSCISVNWRQCRKIYMPFLAVMLFWGLVSHNMMSTYFILLSCAWVAAYGSISARKGLKIETPGQPDSMRCVPK